MSAIFRGDHEGRTVAIKVPLVGLGVSEDTTSVMEEVERELDVTKKCSHPQVVQIFGLMVGPGRIGIVMEYCDGGSFAKYIRDSHQNLARPFNWEECINLLTDAAQGLAFIHAHRSTTHGDVKPENMLIQHGRLKIADFGLAIVTATIVTKFTGELSCKAGTTCFMAPELRLGSARSAAGPNTDVWGFGCVMANAVTGNLPFCEARNEQELLLALSQEKSVYSKQHARSGHPQRMLDLIDRCCNYRASARPTMETVEDELRRILSSCVQSNGFGLPSAWLERGCSLDDHVWRMLPCASDSTDYKMICRRIGAEMGDCITVLKVEMNANLDLFRRFALERNKVSQENGGYANEAWLWHATRSNAATEDSILEHGFDTNCCGLDYEHFGAGIYLAADSKLSNHYASSSLRQSVLHQYPSTRSMLLVRVACGKIHKREPLILSQDYQALLMQQACQQNLSEDAKRRQLAEKIRQLLRLPENRRCPRGMHSQLGHDISGQRKSDTEIIVTRSFQAFPAYRITYDLSDALPNPLGQGKHELQTLGDYQASCFHKEASSCNLL